ncbi:P-loop containing nucleoside triphosphate hydrolase protein [Cubamyces lactineus]|nr:P-loop containing nucleoside triphosphate hydrolase protein [Cubamyces lactineus]
MMSNRPPCRFHNKPGGCRRTDCAFAHIGSSPPPTQYGVRASPATRPYAPPGVCGYYYENGFCSRGSECRFRHELKDARHGLVASSTAIDRVAALLTPTALARIQGPGTDGFFDPMSSTMRPSEVLHHLRNRFLADGYRFRLPADIYAFSTLLSNASSGNANWSPEDGQLFLSAIGTDNGLLRIADVLSFPEVAIRPTTRNILSFQRGYVPVLRYLSSEYVVKSITSKIVNSLYSLIMEHFDHFSEVVQSCVEEALTKHKSFQESPNQVEISGGQVLSCVAQVLFEYLTRFKNAVATHPYLRHFIQLLREWTNAWVSAVSSDDFTFDDPLSKAPEEARRVLVVRLQELVERLVSIVDRKHRDLERTKNPNRDVHSLRGLATANEGVVAALHNAYQGPGTLRAEGPRHDNDFVNIGDIQIAPTHGELTSPLQPFLPANLYGAPHPLPPESMEQLLDIQFRLLREELTASLRVSAQAILEDLKVREQGKRTLLDELLKKKGGKYRGHAVGQDTVLFNVYTGAQFTNITPSQRGLTVSVTIDVPPGRARATQAKARAHFWESMSSKRLMQGGLIALVWERLDDTTEIHLGTIASSLKDLTDSAKQSADRLDIRIAFFSPEVELRILQELRLPLKERKGTKLLIEATVMFESVRPFLEALRVEPESIPFSRYLVHHPPEFYQTLQISPPTYATLPGFSFQLASLFPPEAGLEDLKLVVTSPESIENAREVLKRSSKLDPSQADAMVDTLTRAVSLMQGPPGTGKSYTGVELLRVLIDNDAGPILMIAFTNHALDHMLRSVLDADITKKIVRLGSRSTDERIAEFSIENMENVAGRTRLSSAYASYRRALRDVEQEIKEFMQDFFKTDVNIDDLRNYLAIACPVIADSIQSPPPWIEALFSLQEAEKDGGWHVTGRNGKASSPSTDTIYEFWLTGRDIGFLHETHVSESNKRLPPSALPTTATQHTTNRFAALGLDDAVTETKPDPRNTAASPKGQQGPDSDSEDSDFELLDASPEEEWLMDTLMGEDEDESPAQAVPPTALPKPVAARPPSVTQDVPVVDASDKGAGAALTPSDFTDPQQFFLMFGCPEVPAVPSTLRPLEELLEQEDAWKMSMQERELLHKMWSDELRVTMQETQTMEFRRLREKHAQAAREYTESQAEIRKQLLRNVDIIGCTTTGAAKLTTLLKGIGPKILLVEEAGQVLEAHILGSLVPSIQHLILIGDPLQLRPTLNNYSLSMDHPHGRLIYKFDMSLMERLSSSGMPMSQINVQRRMRPAIADLIRMTLYPKLEDHDLVKNYPHVRGIAQDVFFFTHDHKENGGEDDFVSKYNQFEVDMIKDLVLYLLRQGTYSSEGDIVVLCAYLGQLARLREALSGEVAVVIDERDQAELDDRSAEADEAGQSGSAFERVKVSHRVLLRTIDNFQGEEAKIVILSLVRNAGGSEEDDAVFGHNPKGRVNIGFLKSENRTNVALSRAREGLYIMGNAQNLSAKSKMWRTVLDELTKRDCLGNAFPIVCQRHPDAVQHVSKPGQLPRLAPDGGCLLQCDTRLSCGHLCPYKCHSDDPRHITVSCEQRCTRLCPRGHPCTKACAVECGRCTTDVELVELPCGHTAASVKCYQLDNLAEVPCSVLLTKDLPGCEHDATMRCSDDPRQVACKVTCNGIMACCGRSCKAQCHQCQMLNTRTDGDQEGSEDVAIAALPRTNHVAHPCQRSLFCGHLCGKSCSQDHECTVFCKEPCRQVCAHARCRNYCSTPCAPCQEPCTWRCSHQSCPLPCGAICARLPCDKRCEQVLECGHRCPSVCGEDCSIQTCSTCAPEEIREKVVDVVMQRTLAELDANSDSLDELTITLPACGHVFTVETLDGICELNEYYRRDGREGRWIGLEAPPSGFKQPPACPTCRAAITAPRYGRVFKRADLDILENNVASHMSQSLNSVRRKVDTFSKVDTASRIKTSAPDVSFVSLNVSNKELKSQQSNLTKILRTVRTTPVALEVIDPMNRGVHSLPPDEAKAWKKLLGTLFTAYRDAKSIAMTRSAHSHAWEASFSYLFQKELDSIAADPMTAPRNPQEYAMRFARMKVGQPPPRADKRFLVESFWASLTIRLTLAELAGEWQDTLASRPKYPPTNKRVWGTYISFLLRSSSSDVEIALKITQESESHRQEATTILLMLRIDLEQFRFNVKMMMQSGKTSREAKNKLADIANAKLSEATARVWGVRHRAARWGKTGGVGTAEWLQAEFAEPAKAILKEWQSLENSLRRDTFYEPVSLEELTQVVKAFRTEFSHTGHFYKCPNGHTFVIGDCGGAMQMSTCPECGAAIGGTGHTLVAGNSRANDLEEILRNEGVRESPWAWGR